MKLTTWTSLIVIELFTLATSLAQAQDTKPREIDQCYADQRRNNPQLFQTLPITHITPDNNHFIFAMKYDALNARINGKATTPSQIKRGYNPDESLKITGSNASPFLGYSYDKIGMGLTGEWGEFHTRYHNAEDSLTEAGDIKFHGFGMHMFLNPIPTMKHNSFNLVGGAKALQVQHKARSSAAVSDSNAVPLLNYHVYKTELGGNINIRLFDALAVIPWASYSKIFTNDIDAKLANLDSSESRTTSSNTNERFYGDADLFWNDQAKLNMGVDVAIKVAKLEFHIGNVMGALLNANKKTSARLSDHSISVGVLLRSEHN